MTVKDMQRATRPQRLHLFGRGLLPLTSIKSDTSGSGSVLTKAVESQVLATTSLLVINRHRHVRHYCTTTSHHHCLTPPLLDSTPQRHQARHPPRLSPTRRPYPTRQSNTPVPHCSCTTPLPLYVMATYHRPPPSPLLPEATPVQCDGYGPAPQVDGVNARHHQALYRHHLTPPLAKLLASPKAAGACRASQPLWSVTTGD